MLRQVPGVGQVLTRTLLAELPELGTLSRQQVAAIGGGGGAPGVAGGPCGPSCT